MAQAVVTKYHISAGLGAGLRLALAADIHERPADDIFALLKREKPDIVLVAGDTLERYDNEANNPYYRSEYGFWDMVFANTAHAVNRFFRLFQSEKKQPKTENAYRFLANAAAVAPVFMCLGNHEEKLLDEDYAFLQKHKIVLLQNSCARLSVKNTELLIGALDPYPEPDTDWLDKFEAMRGKKILLCHRPEYFDRYLKHRRIDLVVSGHAHGGQVRVGKAALYSPGQGFKPKYTKGVYHGRLVVSAGCSNTVAIPRLGNPRELVIINLS